MQAVFPTYEINIFKTWIPWFGIGKHQIGEIEESRMEQIDNCSLKLKLVTKAWRQEKNYLNGLNMGWGNWMKVCWVGVVLCHAWLGLGLNNLVFWITKMNLMLMVTITIH